MTPIPRLAAALIAAVLLAAGCSTPSGDGPAQIGDGSAQIYDGAGTPDSVDTATGDKAPGPGTISQLAPSTTASTAVSTTDSTDTSATDSVEPTAPDAVSSLISTSSGPALPGGTEGLVEMVRRGWLDAANRFQLTAATAEQVTEAEATGTVCEFLFGSVAEVAALTLLPAVSTLGELSGPQLGGEALRFACVYDVGGAPALVLQVGSGPEIDPDLPGGPIIVTVGNLQAVLSYAPGRSGIDPELAEQYLTEAAGRLTVG